MEECDAAASHRTTKKKTEPKLASSFVEGHFKVRAEKEKRALHPMLQDRSTILGFIEFRGDRPFRKYGRGDVTAHLDLIRRLPPNYRKSKRDKARTLVEIADEADRKGVMQRLNERTVERHASALSQFFRYGFDKGEITLGAKEAIIAEQRFYPETGPRQQRDVMTAEERVALFTSLTWASAYAPRDARFWVPLLLLYQGARLEEMADLAGSDVRCEDGIWFLDISPERRRLKNGNAARRVPVHPELLAMGFVEYAAHVAPRPDDPLFPGLKRRKGDGKRGDYLVDWFAALRRKLGIFREGVSLQSMRHGANTRLRHTLMGRDVGALRCIRYMIGHAGGRAEEEGNGEGERRYDKGPPLDDMFAVLSRLTYPDLDFSHLRGWRPDDKAAAPASVEPDTGMTPDGGVEAVPQGVHPEPENF